MSADDFIEDFKNFGGKIASIGQNTADSNWSEISKIGDIDVYKRQVCAYGNPDLQIYGILGSSIKGFDVKVLDVYKRQTDPNVQHLWKAFRKSFSRIRHRLVFGI